MKLDYAEETFELEFVKFLANQIDKYPELVIPADEEQMERIKKLLKEE